MHFVTRRAVSRRVALLTAVLAIAWALVAMTGSSSALVTAVKGEAIGYWAHNITLFGGSQADAGPTPKVDLAPDASNSPQDASVPCAGVSFGPANIFTSDAVTAHTAGSLGEGGSVTSTASATNVNKRTVTGCNGATGSEIFTADSVSATVTATESGVVGSTTITNGTYDVHSNWFNCTSQTTLCGRSGFQTTHPDPNPAGTTPVPTNPAPNTKVAGHVHLSDTSEDFFVIVFNEQITNPDGSLTVNAVHEYLGDMLDANGNIVPDGAPTDSCGSLPVSCLHGNLYIAQVTGGVTATPSATTTTAPTTTTTAPTTTTTAPTTTTTAPTTTTTAPTTTTTAPTTTTTAPTTTTTAPTTTTTAPTTTTTAPTTTTTAPTTTTTAPTTTTTTAPTTTTTAAPGSTTTTTVPTTPTTTPFTAIICSVLQRVLSALPFLRAILASVLALIGCPPTP